MVEQVAELEGELHVYMLRLDQCREDSFRQAWEWLDGEERARANRIRHEPTSRSFITVRSCLKGLLGRYLGQDPATVRFALNEMGKPRLENSEPDRGLVFNVSHSGDFGLIALARDTALGVDVERRREITHMEGMAERCFAPCELAYWRSLPEDRRQSAFFDFWSCKEAFVKAVGQGITLGLEACIVDLTAGPKLVSVPGSCGKTEQWRLAKLDLGQGHAAAVCYRGAERKLRLFEAQSGSWRLID